jgi:hypothetical protein
MTENTETTITRRNNNNNFLSYICVGNAWSWVIVTKNTGYTLEGNVY